MLGIDKDFAKRIERIDWFKNCGNYDNLDLGFDVKIAKNKETAIRSFNSLHWENACLDEEGNFTVFLFLNYRDDYNKWNKFGKKVGRKYTDAIDEMILTAMKKKGFSEDMFLEMRHIVFIEYMLNYYSEFGYESEFWDKMLIIFENGYLPCGWKNSEFMIY